MKDFLSFIGAATIVGLCSGALALVYYEVKDAIHNWRLAYRVKHRFDKPPTAKCYCIDCCFHDPETNRCSRIRSGEWHTADNWFCWEAEPRKRG